jgi:hypothetical protein
VSWTRFKKWIAAILNVVEHERLQDLQFKAIEEASDKFATDQSRRIAATEKRLNAAEALGRFQSVKLHRYEIALADLQFKLKEAQLAIATAAQP